MYNDMLDDYDMVPFPMPDCVYMPRVIEPIEEDLSCMNMDSEDNDDYDYGYDEDEEMEYRQKQNKYNKKNDPATINRICRMIERYNPGIIRTMMSYGMPYQVARRLCRRIVRLTLKYY